MPEFMLQRVNFTGSLKVDCIISYNNIQDNASIVYFDVEFGELKFTAGDLFEALEKVRQYLEDKGFLILCAGSMPNTYPSQVSRQMSNGRKAYIHTLGVKPDRNNIIDIFTPVSIEKVGTMKDQKKFMNEWYNYFKE